MRNDSSEDEAPQQVPSKVKQKVQQQKKQAPSKQQRPACRKIPETLVQSYDLITLKQQKKKRFNFKRIEAKQQPVNNKQLERLTPLFGQCSFTEQIREYQFSELTVYQLTSTLFVISKLCSFRIRNINKIKLISENTTGNEFIPKIVKITWNQDEKEEDFNIFVRLKTVEQAYFLFSSIITRKLLLEDFVLVQLCKDQLKNFQNSITHLEGQIYKMSTFRRKWQKAQAKIEGNLKIFKQGKINSEIKAIKQIWTRFNMHNGYLIVKMFQGLQKIQIGIPLTDYSNVKSERNWLFLLSKLIK